MCRKKQHYWTAPWSWLKWGSMKALKGLPLSLLLCLSVCVSVFYQATGYSFRPRTIVRMFLFFFPFWGVLGRWKNNGKNRKTFSKLWKLTLSGAFLTFLLSRTGLGPVRDNKNVKKSTWSLLRLAASPYKCFEARLANAAVMPSSPSSLSSRSS